jgi:hypothetical protein
MDAQACYLVASNIETLETMNNFLVASLSAINGCSRYMKDGVGTSRPLDEFMEAEVPREFFAESRHNPGVSHAFLAKHFAEFENEWAITNENVPRELAARHVTRDNLESAILHLKFESRDEIRAIFPDYTTSPAANFIFGGGPTASPEFLISPRNDVEQIARNLDESAESDEFEGVAQRLHLFAKNTKMPAWFFAKYLNFFRNYEIGSVFANPELVTETNVLDVIGDDQNITNLVPHLLANPNIKHDTIWRICADRFIEITGVARVHYCLDEKCSIHCLNDDELQILSTFPNLPHRVLRTLCESKLFRWSPNLVRTIT